MADLNAALVQQFLHVPVAQGKAVVQPTCVLDNGHGESVSVGLDVGHGGSAYPDPIKATQPIQGMQMTCSMSRKGDCFDNAVVESFFASLKREECDGAAYPTRDVARQHVFAYWSSSTTANGVTPI